MSLLIHFIVDGAAADRHLVKILKKLMSFMCHINLTMKLIFNSMSRYRAVNLCSQNKIDKKYHSGEFFGDNERCGFIEDFCGKI